MLHSSFTSIVLSLFMVFNFLIPAYGMMETEPSEQESKVITIPKLTYKEKEQEETKTPFQSIKELDETVWILSIDGGGIRGLIPAIVLDYWEKELSKKFDSDIRVADFFDVFAGTSTGAIITLGLAVPGEYDRFCSQNKAEQLVSLYQTKGGKIFGQEWWREAQSYFKNKDSVGSLENLLFEYFQHTKITEAAKDINILVPAYNITKNQAFFFDSFAAKSDKSLVYEMKDVARASSAAPTYFPAANINNEYYRY